MKKNISKIVYPVAALLLPFTTSAVGYDLRDYNIGPNSNGGCPSSVKSIRDLIGLVGCTLASIMPILFVLALLYFLYGAISFIRADDKSRDEARNKILYGIVGLFVMVSVWGLVGVLSGTFGFDNGSIITPRAPSFPTN